MAAPKNVIYEPDPQRQDGLLVGTFNRLLQMLARGAPGAASLRVWLHRLRGVKIGQRAWIGYDSVLETAYPRLITLGDRVTLSIRVTVVAHFASASGVVFEDDVFVGPGAIILPGVTVGHGSVVTAGTVVNRSVPPQTVVQGNPGQFVAKIQFPLRHDRPMQEFMRGYRPMKSPSKSNR
jgi:acetyltransferase-like isoleucine patch superfamily enzyme